MIAGHYSNREGQLRDSVFNCIQGKMPSPEQTSREGDAVMHAHQTESSTKEWRIDEPRIGDLIHSRRQWAENNLLCAVQNHMPQNLQKYRTSASPDSGCNRSTACPEHLPAMEQEAGLLRAGRQYARVATALPRTRQRRVHR